MCGCAPRAKMSQPTLLRRSGQLFHSMTRYLGPSLPLHNSELGVANWDGLIRPLLLLLPEASAGPVSGVDGSLYEHALVSVTTGRPVRVVSRPLIGDAWSMVVACIDVKHLPSGFSLLQEAVQDLQQKNLG
jgi:hypothetical protein